jgi:hypothetical protein
VTSAFSGSCGALTRKALRGPNFNWWRGKPLLRPERFRSAEGPSAPVPGVDQRREVGQPQQSRPRPSHDVLAVRAGRMTSRWLAPGRTGACTAAGVVQSPSTPEPQWIAIAAHRLQYRWRSIDPDQLDEVAADLWREPKLRELEPAAAVDEWLAPIVTPG